MSKSFTKRELTTACERHARGERWHDGPELFEAMHGGSWMGIGTRDELTALMAEGILPADCELIAASPVDLLED